MDEQPTPAEVIGAIKAGDYDGQLVELVEAVRARFANQRRIGAGGSCRRRVHW